MLARRSNGRSRDVRRRGRHDLARAGLVVVVVEDFIHQLELSVSCHVKYESRVVWTYVQGPVTDAGLLRRLRECRRHDGQEEAEGEKSGAETGHFDFSLENYTFKMSGQAYVWPSV